MDFVYENSIPAISMIQQRFNAQKSIMFLLSNVFDPRYAFLIYSPLFFSLDRYTGRKLIWTTVMAEWSNQILKWLLRGERPYWWVLEFESNSASANATLPPINQTPMTCETGPGSPSGHSMITAAVFYILVEALLRRLRSDKQSKKSSFLNSLCWSIYTLILVSVSLSRIFLAAHFPHQCVLGTIIGVAVAMIVSNMDTDSVSRRGYIFGTVGMFSAAMLTYFVLLAFGFNPLWSVERALKWCARRENVHLDTTPFFSMMRYLGFFLGSGLGLHSATYRKSAQFRFDGKMKIISVLLSLVVSKALEKVPIPSNVNVNLVYSMVFAINVLLPYIFVGLVPFVVAKLFGNAHVTNGIAKKQYDQIQNGSAKTSSSKQSSNGKVDNMTTSPKLSTLNDSNNNIRIRSH